MKTTKRVLILAIAVLIFSGLTALVKAQEPNTTPSNPNNQYNQNMPNDQYNYPYNQTYPNNQYNQTGPNPSNQMAPNYHTSSKTNLAYYWHGHRYRAYYPNYWNTWWR